MNITRNGVLFICGREAMVLVSYPDAIVNGVQRYSIGCGHNNDPKYPAGATIDVATGFALMKQDVLLRAVDLTRWLTGAIVNANKFDALMSLYYEYGTNNNDPGNKETPAMILQICRLIVAGRVSEAGLMFLQCDRGPDGKPSSGLLTRRIAEQRLFVAGDYGSIGTIELWRGNPSTTKAELYTVSDVDL